MFGFFIRKRHDDVRKFLQRKMNTTYLRQIRYGPRQDSRGSVTEVALVIPCSGKNETPEIDRLFTAITKDVSAEGLSLVIRQKVECERVVVGLHEENSLTMIVCQIRHRTDLGFGYSQIGLYSEERTSIPEKSLDELRTRLETWSLDELPTEDESVIHGNV